jgi:hypothetical protein
MERPVLRETLTLLKQCRDVIDRKNVWMVQCDRDLRFLLQNAVVDLRLVRKMPAEL